MIAFNSNATSSTTVTFMRYVTDISAAPYFFEAEARAAARLAFALETSGPGSSSRDQTRSEGVLISTRPWRRWSVTRPAPVGSITSQSSAPLHRCIRGGPANSGSKPGLSASDHPVSAQEPSAGRSTTTAGADWTTPPTTDQPPNGERLPSIVRCAVPGAPSKNACRDWPVLPSVSLYAPLAPLSVNRTVGEVVQIVRV